MATNNAQGGISLNPAHIKARKICAFCNREFKTNEGKTKLDDAFYHFECYDELLFKITGGSE